jgi:flagellar biosynthetic protein FliP
MNATVKSCKPKVKKIFCVLFMVCILAFICATPVHAAGVDEIGASGTVTDKNNDFNINISSNAGNAKLTTTLQVLLALTVLSLAPSILIMVTSFTRILVVLHFVRSALGTMTTPPNQILIGLALFLTFFIMNPVINEVNTTAVQPYTKGEITQQQAIEKGLKPIKTFMFKQTNRKDLKLFINIAEIKAADIQNEDDIPITVLIPSFIISELRTAFIIGFIIYLPFIVIDMVVASTLMSMGMMMLPPTTISMPFKILLFILADGWGLVIGQLVKTFH